MPNARYNGSKGSQRNSDERYEGEQGNAGGGEHQSTSGEKRDHVANFQKGDQTNPMQGHGAKQPQQAEYKVKWQG